MSPEFSLGGVYISAVVPTALAGLAATILLRRMIARLGLYRLVWQPALVDAALFLILWAAIAGLAAKV